MTYQLVSERKAKYEVRIVNPEDAWGILKRYARAKQEQFIVLLLNNANMVTNVVIASIGTVNRTIAHPRDIFRPALINNASNIILAHNHPSGELKPSDEDREVTDRLVKSGDLLGVPVLDHLIFSKTGYTSLKEQGHRFS